TVVIVGGQYHLWYSGVAADQHSRIAHATSPDGIVWTKDAANPVMDLGLPGSLDDQELIHPFAIYESPRFRLWYNGYGGTPDAQRILYAESLDGVSWTRHPVAAIDLGNPGDWDDTQLYMMCVVRFAGLYTMFYTASNTSSEFGIGYATSPDAITWSRRSPSAPVLSPGLPGAWDDLAVARPIVVQSGPEFLLWYGGTRDFQTFSWGLATAATPTDVAIPSESSSGLHVGPVRPNPSSGVVALETTSRTMTLAEIEVVDVLGRRVWFGTRRVPAGTGRIEWPGRDRNGNLVSPGTYVVRVRLAGEEHRRKAVVVR
ncbi:MAG: hypothetical protein KC591_13585, partial [Gemmatimonadetes bacterium]|nr:hypothetical protein [Gemmatimonadota bacterium]